jgi:hypothetical protein
MSKDLFLIMDIRCNKGYTSADFIDALSPETGMNPKNLVKDVLRTHGEWRFIASAKSGDLQYVNEGS